MERVRRSRADEIGGDEVAGAVAAATAVSDQCRAQARQRRASVLQHADQVSAYRCLGDRWASGLPLGDDGGTFLAANQGTSIPSYWRFDAFVEAKVDKNWTAKLFVNNITNKLYYDALYQSATPFVFVAPGRSVSMVISARF